MDQGAEPGGGEGETSGKVKTQGGGTDVEEAGEANKARGRRKKQACGRV